MASLTDYRGVLATEEPRQGILAGIGQGGILSGIRDLRNRERGRRPVLDFLGDRSAALTGMGLALLTARTQRQAFEGLQNALNSGRQVDFARGQQRREEASQARKEQALATVLQHYGLDQGLSALPEVAQAAIVQAMKPPEDIRTDDILEFERAQRDPAFAAFLDRNQRGANRPTPYTDPGKLQADLNAGYITPEQYQEQLAAGGMEPPKPSDILAARKELAASPGTSRYRASLPVLASMVSSVDNDSAMSDLDFVYGLAQIYDPDSVVREAEMGFVIQGQSIPSYILGLVDKYATGAGQLSAEGRREIVKAVRRRVEQYRQQAMREAQDFTDIATRWEWDPRDIVRPLDEMPPEPPPMTAQQAIQAARDAIARGADPEAVKQRLRENGIDPGAL